MRVEAEEPVPPAHEQTKREKDDQGGDGGLGPLLEAPRQILLEEQDREPEEDECQRVPEPPERSEARGSTIRVLARGDERRDRCDVIRVRRVPETQKRGDEEDDADRGAAREVDDQVVEPEHVVLLS